MVKTIFTCLINASLIMLLLLQGAYAGTLKKPELYAYQAEIKPSDEALQRVQIPLQVMLQLTRSDLGDVVVFDASGHPLPSWLRQHQTDPENHTEALSFNRFSAYINSHSQTITRRENGDDQQLYPQVETTEVLQVQNTRHDYVIELTEEQQKLGITQLELDWNHEPSDQLLQLKVETGDSIDNWKLLHKSKNLSNRTSDNDEWKVIKGIPAGRKYIRLTPLNSLQAFQLKQVSGIYQIKQPPLTISHQVDGLASSEKDGDYYEFTLPSNIHPKFIKLIPSQPNQLISGDLYASQKGEFDDKYLIKADIKQHNIPVSDEVKASEPIRIHANHETKWWFKPDSPFTNKPEIEFTYTQYELLFLANNNGPYKLAWGNYEAGPAENDLISILNKKAQAQSTQGKQVELSDSKISGGELRLQAEAKAPWLKWLLWVFMLIAILVTARMAMTLYKDMKNA